MPEASTSIPATTSPTPASPRRRRWYWLRAFLIAIALLLLAAIILDRVFPLQLPAPGNGAVVLARDGTPLRAFADSDGEWRYPTTVGQVSPLYLKTLLTYEDRWFYWHPGVNPYALLRGLAGGIVHGHIVSGGSTLTMQVARIVEPISQRFGQHTVRAKFVQILRALQLEVHLSKAQILELYLNHAPFGGPIEGVEAASWAYLGKSASQLSRAEAALLTVLPQAPSRLRPDRHPRAARVARDKVLRRMREAGAWSAAQVRAAEIEPVVARSLRTPQVAALLAERLHRQYPDKRRIVSTIDANLQRAAEARVGAYLSRLAPRTSTAVLVVDNATLEARVYVGTGDFADPRRHGYIDMVQAARSPGSTLKPFLYGLALDDGLIHSQSLLVDAPQDFGGYKPGNFDEAFSGPVSAAEALQRSLNVPAVEVLDRVGPNRFMARLANGGIRLGLPAGAKPNLSIILGGAATTLESLVGGYTALANAGIAGTPRYTTAQPARPRRLLSPGAAWIVRDILAANPADVEGAPLAGTIHRHAAVAWKTGTSYGYRDAWSIGVTDRWTIGVWIGRPDGTPSPGQYGAVTALPLLFQIVDILPARGGRASSPPASVRALDICWPLGRAYDATAPELCRQRRTAWVLDGAVPPTFAEQGLGAWASGRVELRVDEQGRRLSGGCHAPHEQTLTLARWPPLATPWLSESDRASAALPPLAPQCAPDSREVASPIRIAGLSNGVVLRAAPNGGDPLRVTLHTLGTPHEVQWLVDGRLRGSSVGAAPILLSLTEAGDHRITALAADGAYAVLRLHVAAPRR